jgi:hypothetical protein
MTSDRSQAAFALIEVGRLYPAFGDTGESAVERLESSSVEYRIVIIGGLAKVLQAVASESNLILRH